MTGRSRPDRANVRIASGKVLSRPGTQRGSQLTPLVTVVIPCHNAADFVGHAIRSALDQSWKQIEVVVVDDASTDESLSVISTFDQQVKVISLPINHGAASARNRGAEASSGDFILFLDADDLLDADAVAAMVAASTTHKDCIAACRFSYLIPANGSWKRVTPRARTYAGGDQLLAWLEGNWSPPCALLWPREAYESIGGWNEALSRNDDGDIVMRALASGVRITATERGEAFYRRHKGTRLSVSATRKSESHLESGIKVLTGLAIALSRQGRLEAYSRAIREELAELALLAFKAGFETLGCRTIAIARSLGSVAADPGTLTVDARDPGRDGQSMRFARAYAVTLRSRGQVRRWLKRRRG